MEATPDFNPTTPHSNARELLARWRAEEHVWDLVTEMVNAYGETETIKLFEAALYEELASSDLHGLVFDQVTDLLRAVGLIGTRKS